MIKDMESKKPIQALNWWYEVYDNWGYITRCTKDNIEMSCQYVKFGILDCKS